MKPLIRIWHSFESSVALLETVETWKRLMGEEFTPLSRFLVATDYQASTYPGLDQYRHYRVVDLGDRILGVDDESGASVELSPADVCCHRFNVRAFSAELAEAIGLSHQFESVPEAFHSWRLGALPVQLGATPVYMTLRVGTEELVAAVSAIANHARQPYLLLHPAVDACDGLARQAIQLSEGRLARLADLVGLGDDGRLCAVPDVPSRLAAIMGIEPTTPSDTPLFRLEGEYRAIAMDGKRICLKESAGLWYIQRLLQSPSRDISAVDLESARTGVRPEVATGSAGEAFDAQARAEYKERIDDLDTDIAEAERNCDLGQLERLQTEREQLIDTLRKATGLGGRTRVKTDADRARKAVSNAVAREIRRIRKHHPSMATHLEGAIFTGLVLRYAPDRKIEWNF